MVANVFNPNTQEAKIGGWEILRTAWIKSETYKWELPEISCDCSVNFSGIKRLEGYKDHSQIFLAHP